MTTPDATEAWLDDIFNAIETDALACGWFDRVNGAEPLNAPGHGLTCAWWLQSGPDPIGQESGLTASSGLLVFNVRTYTPFLQQPRDEIDPRVAKANCALMRRWHDNYDFGLHPLVRNVDLYGQTGTRLTNRAGYVEVSGQMCRVMTITLPVIINDVFTIGS